MRTIQLFCLPYAGGSPEFFKGLKELLADKVELIALEYAGHGSRRTEPFYEDFTALAQDMAEKINAQLRDDSLFLLFGYSMGTVGVYEIIAQKLLKRQPDHVFLASHEAPDGDWECRKYMTYTDEDFWEMLKQFGGMDGVDDKMLKNRFFKHLFFKPIREDYRLLGQYKANRRAQFPMDVTVVYAPADIPEEKAAGWERFCDAGFDIIAMGENHFFLKTMEKEMAEVILERLP